MAHRIDLSLDPAAVSIGLVERVAGTHIWPAHCGHESGVDAVAIPSYDDVSAIFALEGC